MHVKKSIIVKKKLFSGKRFICYSVVLRIMPPHKWQRIKYHRALRGTNKSVPTLEGCN